MRDIDGFGAARESRCPSAIVTGMPTAATALTAVTAAACLGELQYSDSLVHPCVRVCLQTNLLKLATRPPAFCCTRIGTMSKRVH